MRQMRWERSAPMCQIDEISAEEESSAEKFLEKTVYIVVKMGTIHKG